LSSGRLAVGLALGGSADATGWSAFLARAEHAEALGLHSVWVPEGHFRRGAMASPLLALSAAAARTRRVRVGTTSLLLPVHHPLRLAQEVAALDVLSQGRVMLGLGRGFAAPLFQAFGVEAHTKRDRFEEALDAMLRAFGGVPMELAGDYFATEGGRVVTPTLRPLQRPHPPLLVAAFGRKGLLQAARRGLPYLASPLETLGVLIENHALHRAHLPPGGVVGPFRTAVMRTVYLTPDDGEASRVRERLAAEALGTARALPPALARAAAGPIRERVVVGGENEVIDGLLAYREQLGMDLLIVRSEITGLAEDLRRRSLERLCERVFPCLNPVPAPPG
jgi:alkanesulfonate monooxygenase SsuD/methylene tetrahydromethanopterin reductase-like flavin-dependent oxidoreductase (luciferase family)